MTASDHLNWLKREREGPDADREAANKLKGKEIVSPNWGRQGFWPKFPIEDTKIYFEWIWTDSPARTFQWRLNTRSRRGEYVLFCVITVGRQGCQGTGSLQLDPPVPASDPLPPPPPGPSGCLRPCNASLIASSPKSVSTATLRVVTSCTLCFLFSRKSEWRCYSQAQNR